jgi:hypothetical protein
MNRAEVTRATFTIAAIAFVSSAAAATSPPVTFESPCSCHDNHGEHRWAQQWCSIRETVFSWTTTRFPFHTSSDRKLKLIGAPIITGAFLVAFGFLTRLAAASLALGMAGALYTSVRLGEDWLRAALYLIIFVVLSLTGPGKFSLDHLLKRKKSPATKG